MSRRMHPLVGPVLAAGGIALGAQITVDMVPVPMTLQTLVVLLAGLTLGPRGGALATGLYLVAVLVGLPVLADGGTAPGRAFLELKSAGYVVGFIGGAWLAGRMSTQRRFTAWLGAGLAGHAVVLVLGTAVLASWIGAMPALEHGLLPFLPGAVLKSVAAAVLAWGMTHPG